MRRVTVKQHYEKTISLEDGLSYELNLAEPRMRFWVLQKHIRFQVINAIVQRAQNMDLKRYILRNHHKGEQLSQRDITAKIKKIVDEMDNEHKLAIIKEVLESIWQMLKEMLIADLRRDLTRALNLSGNIDESAKRALFNRAIENNDGRDVLEKLKSFDHKTIADFIQVFRLPVRRAHEKWSGKSTRKKFAKNRTKQNRTMWADPQMKTRISNAVRASWPKRRDPALHGE